MHVNPSTNQLDCRNRVSGYRLCDTRPSFGLWRRSVFEDSGAWPDFHDASPDDIFPHDSLPQRLPSRGEAAWEYCRGRRVAGRNIVAE